MEKYKSIIDKLNSNNIEIKTDIIIDDNSETVTSRIDGTQRKRIYGRYLKSIGITSDEYKYLFPEAPMMCQSDKTNTALNSGQHMKTEKYKKMFSEKIIGEKNPNHKTKTTEDERKSRSPFSLDFIKYEKEEQRSDFIKDVCKNKSYSTRLDYWINKGFSKNEAALKLKDRQQTFTLEKCIIKYGENEGRVIWNNRQEKWITSLHKNGNLKCGYSNVSQILFNSLLKYYNLDELEYIKFATKSGEYKLSNGIRTYIYDFVDLKNKKIIEYNGDQYHANPKMYEADETPHPFRKKVTAEEIWEKDKRKKDVAEEHGFIILSIWDSEYKHDKVEQIEKCINFLFDKN